VSGWFVPAVVLVALAAFVGWRVLGPQQSFIYGLVAAVSVLIISCHCAPGLATLISIMTATGRGAQSGVLVREAAALERLAAIDVLIVDKTGTLTEGKQRLTDVLVEPNYPADHTPVIHARNATRPGKKGFNALKLSLSQPELIRHRQVLLPRLNHDVTSRWN